MLSAEGCQPLCGLDTQRPGRCQVNPVYTANLLDRLSPESIWGEVAAQNLACRSLNASTCSSQCEFRDGTCMMHANWIARRLSNASIGGIATKCGLLGQIMADEVTCYELDRTVCTTTNGTSCSWDGVRGVCGISPTHVLVLLRQDRSWRRENWENRVLVDQEAKLRKLNNISKVISLAFTNHG